MGTLVNSDHDPFSGQPELKITRIQLRPLPLTWQGFILSRQDLFATDGSLSPLDCDYWAYGLTSSGHFYEVAGNQSALDFMNTFKQRCEQQLPGQWLSLDDNQRQHHRWACIKDGQLQAIAFVQGIYEPEFSINRQWLIEQFTHDDIDALTRKALLGGKAPGKQSDPGKIICSCFQVGENAIKAAIEQGAENAAALGQKLQCGTNCGSCIPELTALTQQYCRTDTTAELITELGER